MLPTVLYGHNFFFLGCHELVDYLDVLVGNLLNFCLGILLDIL